MKGMLATIFMVFFVFNVYAESEIERLTKACNAGNAKSCIELGCMYHNGKGVRQNSLQARNYYGMACDMKNQDACDAYSRLNKFP